MIQTELFQRRQLGVPQSGFFHLSDRLIPGTDVYVSLRYWGAWGDIKQ